MFPRRRPENDQVFSVRTVPIGGARGQTRSVFDENRPIETATKINSATFFRFFPSPKTFCRSGPLPTKPVPNRQNDPQSPRKRPHLGTHGHMGPQTGFTGSAIGMRSNLVSRRSAQNSPRTGKIHLFSVFGLF